MGDRGATALSSEKPARAGRQGREAVFRSPPARRRSGIRFREGRASPGRPVGTERKIFGAKPARGAGRDDRLTAAGRIPRKGRSGQRERPIVPRRAANGRYGGRPNRSLACQGTEREAGLRTGPTLEAVVFARTSSGKSRGKDQDRRSRLVDGQRSSDRSLRSREATAEPDGRDEGGRKAVVGAEIRGRSPGNRAADRDRRDA